ncbi:MAG: diaminopimelate epimerase [bacterium]
METLIPGPIFDPCKIPISAPEPRCEIRLSGGMTLQGTALSLGNPHFVVWKESIDLRTLIEEVKTIGGEIEHHRIFPQRVNFELASQVDTHKVFMAVWERGVGPTRACGSGATATVCAGVFQGILPPDEDITVEMEGGSLQIKVSSDLSKVSVRGPAHWVFSGNFPVKKEMAI